MKKLFLMALTSIALVSCVSNEVDDVAQKSQKAKIVFESPLTYTNSNSRANVSGSIGPITYGDNNQMFTYPRNEKFIVYAIQHTNPYSANMWESATHYTFDGDSIAWDSSLDGWAPKTTENKFYYWPDAGYLSFAATSPATLYNDDDTWKPATHDRTYGNTGLIIKDFKVAPYANRQYDLLYGQRVLDCQGQPEDNASGYNGIPIVFKHALSSIRFSFKKATGVVQDVKLHRIALFGITDQATFKEGIVEATNLTAANPGWTEHSTNLIDKEHAYVAFECEDGLSFPEGVQYVSTYASNQLSADEYEYHSLLVIPQELTTYIPATTPGGSDDVNGAALAITYSVDGIETTVYKNIDDLEGAKRIDADNVSSTKTTISKWELGTQYVYRLVIDGEAINAEKIYFAPHTTDWQEYTAIEVHI